MLYTMTSPHTYHTLKKEINTAIDEGRISSPITHEEGKQLPYLQVGFAPSSPCCFTDYIHV